MFPDGGRDKVVTSKYYVPLPIECQQRPYSTPDHDGVGFYKIYDSASDEKAPALVADLESVGHDSSWMAIKTPKEFKDVDLSS